MRLKDVICSYCAQYRTGLLIIRTLCTTESPTISRLEDSPQISLFFNRHDFDDVLRRKSHVTCRPVALKSTAADYVFHLRNGHPGVVEAILGVMERFL